MNLRAIPTMLSMIPSALTGVTLNDLEKIKKITRLAFPTVPQLSTATLAEWMDKPDLSALLIDVRSPAEFAVSHLRNAINLRTTHEIAQAINDRNPTKTILYCSVGFRSSRLAQHLTKQSVAPLYNLEGSIFQWANEARPLYHGQTPVQKVHPYSPRWAGLLKKGLARNS